MKKNKRIKKIRRTGYTPVTTSSRSRISKKHDFRSKGQNERVNQIGMDIEKSSVQQKTIFYFVGLIVGTILTILDIRDEGMMIEVFGLKYTGSIAGVALALLCIVGMIRNKPKMIVE